MYLVLNATEPIRTLTRHFDNLIRAADINAHEAAAHAESLAETDFASAVTASDPLTRHKDFFISLSQLDLLESRIAMTNPIDALLAEKGVLLADGATGTNLFAMGLEAGEAPELGTRRAPGKDHGAAPEFRRCRRRHHPHQFLRRHAPAAEAAQCAGSRARAEQARRRDRARRRRQGRPQGHRRGLGRPDRRAARAARRA